LSTSAHHSHPVRIKVEQASQAENIPERTYGLGVSISFDRAASFYDKTRGLPQQEWDQLTDLLTAELGAARTLEIGVGTGRIALPLHHRGVRLVGVDLSVPMLQRLTANAGGEAPFPLFVADATRLPFKNASYDALIASHVFHLIPDWQLAADEALRVVRPGGVLLVDFGGGIDTPWREWAAAIFRGHGIVQVRPGISDSQPMSDHYGDRVRKRALPPIRFDTPHTIRRDLELLERQTMSWTWAYTPEQLREAADEARARAGGDGLDLDAEVQLTYVMQWWAFDLVPA
jgi:ubiquinone/menaquinone biosynthesis C-methylase UbiE